MTANIIESHWHELECEPSRLLVRARILVLVKETNEICFIWGIFDNDQTMNLACCPFCKTILSCDECNCALTKEEHERIEKERADVEESLCNNCLQNDAIDNTNDGILHDDEANPDADDPSDFDEE